MKTLYFVSMCYYMVRRRSIKSSNRYPFSNHIDVHRASIHFNTLRPASTDFWLGLKLEVFSSHPPSTQWCVFRSCSHIPATIIFLHQNCHLRKRVEHDAWMVHRVRAMFHSSIGPTLVCTVYLGNTGNVYIKKCPLI
jgi:hypothetical protein